MATKIQVIFYSMYGHIYRMAEAIAAGAREVPGAEVTLWQVPELVPAEVLEKSGAQAARAAFASVPVATPEQLAIARFQGETRGRHRAPAEGRLKKRRGRGHAKTHNWRE
jgi:multimeric flavodoxin WrbA